MGSLIMSAISVIVSLIAIILSFKEAKRSEDNFKKTQEVLKEIELKSAVIEAAVQVHQAHLVDIINSVLGKMNAPVIDYQPLSTEEINAILNDEEVPVQVTGQMGKRVIDFESVKGVASALEERLRNI